MKKILVLILCIIGLTFYSQEASAASVDSLIKATNKDLSSKKASLKKAEKSVVKLEKKYPAKALIGEIVTRKPFQMYGKEYLSFSDKEYYINISNPKSDGIFLGKYIGTHYLKKTKYANDGTPIYYYGGEPKKLSDAKKKVTSLKKAIKKLETKKKELINKKNGKTTIKYSNATYVGKVNSKGQENGQGKLVFNSGETYDGAWKNGFMEGKGTYTDKKNKEKYVGQFKKDIFEGKGTFIKNGAKYVGQFKNWELEGKGTYTKNSAKYVGQFKKGKFEGKGTYTKDGAKYVGQFKNWKLEGKGTYTKKGEKYTGQFKKGKFEGKGTYTKGETKYVGSFKNNYKNGLGTYTSGSMKYVGNFKDGKYHGKGVKTSKTLLEQNGTFSKGEFVKGIYKKKNGETYNCHYNEAGKCYGEGTYTKGNTKYVGTFENGKYERYGKLNTSNGDYYVGDFSKGLYDGYGKLSASNGDYYVGDFSKGLYEGEGTLWHANGTVSKGYFSKNKLIYTF